MSISKRVPRSAVLASYDSTDHVNGFNQAFFTIVDDRITEIQLGGQNYVLQHADDTTNGWVQGNNYPANSYLMSEDADGNLSFIFVANAVTDAPANGTDAFNALIINGTIRLLTEIDTDAVPIIPSSDNGVTTNRSLEGNRTFFSPDLTVIYRTTGSVASGANIASEGNITVFRSLSAASVTKADLAQALSDELDGKLTATQEQFDAKLTASFPETAASEASATEAVRGDDPRLPRRFTSGTGAPDVSPNNVSAADFDFYVDTTSAASSTVGDVTYNYSNIILYYSDGVLWHQADFRTDFESSAIALTDDNRGVNELGSFIRFLQDDDTDNITGMWIWDTQIPGQHQWREVIFSSGGGSGDGFTAVNTLPAGEVGQHVRVNNDFRGYARGDNAFVQVDGPSTGRIVFAQEQTFFLDTTEITDNTYQQIPTNFIGGGEYAQR